MTFNELLEIVNTHIDFSSNTIPTNCCPIATQQLNIKVKNSLQCKIDAGSPNTPLDKNEAIYTLFKGEYTIYHDENHPYKNFFIAHEIAHHLLNHQSDDINKHHDANLLGAMIVAPPHLIKKNKISNSTQLAFQCKIPVEVAESYWKEYINSYLKDKHKKTLKYSIISACTGLLIVCFVFIALQLNSLKTAKITYIQESTSTYTTEITTSNISAISSEDVVYVTRTGEKYHQSNCIYIEDKTDLTEMSIDEAVQKGYEECKICGK